MNKDKDKKTVVVSLGGSIIVPKPNEVDQKFLKAFHRLILGCVRKGYRFVITVGGGKINRHYNEVARSINKEVENIDLDWLGIAATRFNAELLRVIFADFAYSEVIANPTTKIRTEKPIIIGCGYKPGHSTDVDAILWAKNIGAEMVINLSNIDYVYTDDPNKNPEARPIKKISWQDFLQMLGATIGAEWKPRMNTPFDPVAAQLAKKSHLTVIVANGRNILNLRKILAGKPFVGTVIGGQ